MMSAAFRRWTGASLILAAAIASFSCETTDYSSPLPGTLEIHLAVKNSRASGTLPWSGGATGFGYPQSSLILKLSALETREESSFRLPIYADVAAIKRNPQGDYFNLLSPQARDSALVLGRVYAPPATYNEIELRTLVQGGVTVVDTSTFSAFEVRTPPGELVTDLVLLSGLSVEVQEARNTRVTITMDLDSSLVRRTEWFELHPTFYVSSVVIY